MKLKLGQIGNSQGVIIPKIDLAGFVKYGYVDVVLVEMSPAQEKTKKEIIINEPAPQPENTGFRGF